MRWIRDLISRFRPKPGPEQARASVPLDPSGAPATGETQHLIVEEGADSFLVHSTQHRPGSRLTWFSSDTSVARIEPLGLSRSARIVIVGQGTATVRVSDGINAESRQIVVRQRPAPPLKRLGLTIG